MLISLQYLRAVAALLVVYFHLALQVDGLSEGQSFLPLTGKSGVDIFFALSGFVIWKSNLSGDRNPWNFYKRRIARLVPLYWGATATAAAAALFMPHLLASTQFDPMHFLASLFFIPWPNPSFPPTSGNYLTPIVIPGWSLNYEMFFYLLFGLVLPFRPALRALWLVISFVALFIAGSVTANPPHAIAFYATGYLLDFLLGVGIAALAPRMSAPSPSISVALLVSAGLLLVAFDMMHLGPARIAMRGVAAAAIVYAAVALEQRRAVPAIPVLGILGEASYSIYLTHVFVLAALRTVWTALDLPIAFMGQIIFLAAGLAVSAAVGTLVHILYERPATRVTRRLLRA